MGYPVWGRTSAIDGSNPSWRARLSGRGNGAVGQAPCLERVGRKVPRMLFLGHRRCLPQGARQGGGCGCGSDWPQGRWELPKLSVLVLLALFTPLSGQGVTQDVGPETATETAGLGVKRIVLENGMTVLALHRPGAPVVSLVVRYSVGGVNERLGTTGAAHLLEHMLFKGSETVGTRDWEAEKAFFPLMDAAHDSLLNARANGNWADQERLSARITALEDSSRAYADPGEFDRILRRAGARGLNATTSTEATTYFVDLPAHRLEEWFRLEADRMANPVLRGFYSERRVVIEERLLRVEGDPAGALSELHLATAFQVHPYGAPVVGHLSDLQNVSRAEVARYHARYYGAGNAIVGVVGAINPDEVERLAQRYFGGLPGGSRPPPVLTEEPEQRG